MIELIEAPETTEAGGTSINELLNKMIEPNRLPPNSYEKNGIYYRLIGYVESKNGAIIGKYEPVFFAEKPKLNIFERFVEWIKS